MNEKIIKTKVRVNKKNGQINVNLPKKKLPKMFLKDIDNISNLKIKLCDWY